MAGGDGEAGDRGLWEIVARFGARLVKMAPAVEKPEG